LFYDFFLSGNICFSTGINASQQDQQGKTVVCSEKTSFTRKNIYYVTNAV